MKRLFVRLVPYLWFRLGLIHLWRFVPRRLRKRLVAVVLGGAARERSRLPAPASPILLCGLMRGTAAFGWVARETLQLAGEAGIPAHAIDLSPILARDRAGGEPPPPVPGRILEGPGTLILCINPNWFPHVRGFLPGGLFEHKYLIASCAWELERIPADWVAQLAIADEVWVPSRFVAAAFESAGVRLPHRIVPPLIAGLREVGGGRARFGLGPDVFVALTVFSFSSGLSRKNPRAALAAFREAFAPDAAVRLILKVADTGANPRGWAELRRDCLGDPRILLVDEVLDDDAMWALMGACDAVLSLHRAEGFGMVPAQGMLLGKAVVATGWSGNLDFMRPENSVLVPYRLVPVDDPEGLFEDRGLRWAEADVGAAARALRRLHDDEGWRKALGAAARRNVADYLAGHRRSLREYLERIGRAA